MPPYITVACYYHAEIEVPFMTTKVRACPRCDLLMWIKDEDIEYPDENTMRAKCPHCQQIVTMKLVVQGSNSTGPKMGH